jgi:dipeptidyl aminopeptidase/acylaminoacyl peptidase
MTLKAIKFTPEVLLSAPRRSPAVTSPDGTKALFTVTTYSFESHKKTSQIRVLDIKSGQSTLLVEDLGASEPTWVSDDEFIYFKGWEKGKTILIVDSVSLPGGAA